MNASFFFIRQLSIITFIINHPEQANLFLWCFSHLQKIKKLTDKFCECLVAEIGLEPTTLRVWTECSSQLSYSAKFWLRGQDLNLWPSGYEPDELPTAPPRVIWCWRPESNRYGELPPQDFKSCASASSATPASLNSVTS